MHGVGKILSSGAHTFAFSAAVSQYMERYNRSIVKEVVKVRVMRDAAVQYSTVLYQTVAFSASCWPWLILSSRCAAAVEGGGVHEVVKYTTNTQMLLTLDV
jgi:hypothetical protein